MSKLEEYSPMLESSRIMRESSKVVEQSIVASSTGEANEGDEKADKGDAAMKSSNDDEAIAFPEVEKDLSSFEEH